MRNKRFSGKPIILTILLFSIFCAGIAGLAYWWYDVRLFEPGIYVKYLFSLLFDAAGIKFITVDIPKGLYEYVFLRGYHSPSIILCDFQLLIHRAKFSDLFSLLPYFLFGSFVTSIILVWRYLSPQGESAKYVRGAEIATEKKLVKLLTHAQKRDTSGSPGLAATPLHIPGDLETRHFLTAGSTGTGKSALLCQLMKGMQQRNAKQIIYDRKGELYAKFGRQEDILWNPYDKRFCGWTIFNEFEFYAGLDHIPEALSSMADSLFSVSNAAGSTSKHFYDGAASVFKSGCCYLKINNMTTNRELYNSFFCLMNLPACHRSKHCKCFSERDAAKGQAYFLPRRLWRLLKDAMGKRMRRISQVYAIPCSSFAQKNRGRASILAAH